MTDNCTQCRDWGSYERHSDHYPVRTPEAEARLQRRLAEAFESRPE